MPLTMIPINVDNDELQDQIDDFLPLLLLLLVLFNIDFLRPHIVLMILARRRTNKAVTFSL